MQATKPLRAQMRMAVATEPDLSSTPPGETKMPEPTMTPTMRERLPSRPTSRRRPYLSSRAEKIT